SLEAMARGAAIITSGTGVVRHEETGLLVPARDPGAIAAAIKRLLGDKELAGRLARNGRVEAYKEKYQWANIAARRVGIYRQAMRRPARPSDVGAPVIPVNGNVFDVLRVHLGGRGEGEGWELWHGHGSHSPMQAGSSR